jgi:dihydrodipicolinate synthase/N-acetylneuraminate lyase
MIPPGVYCPTVSLYKPTARQEIDLDASYKYFSHLIRGGVDGLVLQGSTAEAVLLSPEERISLTKTARRAALDLGATNFPLVAGASGQSTNETLKLTQEAAAAGADFALILPPSYWAKAVTKDVIVSFFEEVADNSPIPVVIYNVSRFERKCLKNLPCTVLTSVPVSRCLRWNRSLLRRPLNPGKTS